ncbi:MAG: response regulator transcription factor [Planctomycetota bacterium]|nr:response regulator transcription factor [Planctomycetota bacterium]
MSVRVILADSHEVVRAGLREVFAGTEIDVVAEAATVAEAVNLVERQRPDVALMDVRFDGESSLDVLDRIREKAPDTCVVILTAYENPTYVARAAALGAGDYLLKTLTSRDLVSAVLAAAAGRTPTRHGILHPIAETMAASGKLRNDMSLTQREIQVLRHLGLGLSNKEIASSLDISVDTAKEHVQNILRKIKASDRTQAAVWAIGKQLV